MRLLRYVERTVFAHGHDRIGDFQVVTTPADDEDRADAPVLVELADPVHEGRDGLALLGHQGLHAPVPDHEVGGGGVLVDQQGAGPGFDRLHDGCCLGGRAGRVGRRERFCGPSHGESCNEGRDVDAAHRPPVFGPDLHHARDGNDTFPSVSRPVVVHAALEGPKEGALAVVPASDDHRDAFRNAHAGHVPRVRQLHVHPQRARRSEGDDPTRSEGPVVDAARTGQDRAVGDEGQQPALAQLQPERVGVLVGLDHLLQDVGVMRREDQGALDEAQHLLREESDCVVGQYPAPRRRQSHPEPGLDAPVLLHGDRGLDQHLLPRRLHLDLAALSRSVTTDLPRVPRESAGQV